MCSAAAAPRPSPGPGEGRGAFFPPLPPHNAGVGSDENLQSAGLHVAARGGREPGRCGAACGGAGRAAGLGEAGRHTRGCHAPPAAAFRVSPPRRQLSVLPNRNQSVICQPLSIRP